MGCCLFGAKPLPEPMLINCQFDHWEQTSGPRFNIKMSSYQYRKSHCGDKTVVRSSYLHNGISYTGKMTSLYWIRAQWDTNWNSNNFIQENVFENVICEMVAILFRGRWVKSQCSAKALAKWGQMTHTIEKYGDICRGATIHFSHDTICISIWSSQYNTYLETYIICYFCKFCNLLSNVKVW